MDEKEQVVDGGQIEIGGTGAETDPLNPNTLEEKIENQDEQSLSQEEITEKALKELKKFFLEGVYSIRGSLEGREFSIKALLTGQRVSDEIFNLNQNLRFSTVSIGKLLGDSSQYLSHFIEKGVISLYKFNYMSRMLQHGEYVRPSINAIDNIPIAGISKNTMRLTTYPEKKITTKAINDIYSKDKQDKKDIQEVLEHCEGKPRSFLDLSLLGRYFSELKPILDLDEAMCLAVQNAYLPVARMPKEFMHFFAIATYKKIGEQQYNREDKAPLTECTRETPDLLSSADIRRCRRETKILHAMKN